MKTQNKISVKYQTTLPYDIIIRKIIADPEVKDNAMRFYTWLINYIKWLDGGTCYLTNKSINKRYKKLSKSTITRILQNLQDAGYITVQINRSTQDGKHSTYRAMEVLHVIPC